MGVRERDRLRRSSLQRALNARLLQALGFPRAFEYDGRILMYTWHVAADDQGKRLDLFAKERAVTSSRQTIQFAIKRGEIRVNGLVVTPHHFLKEGDSVVWGDDIRVEDEISSLPTPVRKTLLPLTIIQETAAWMVIDKPIGVLTHPTTRTTEPTLVDMVLAHDPGIAKIGEDPSRPGIVHRLDREVSGLMVVAKTQHAFDELKRQFAQRETEKTYLALVHGVVKEDEGDLRFSIARSTTSARMAARPKNDATGKAAWTHYDVRERLLHATLLELQILSGRTHQIRAHLFAFQHPIMGDELYKQRAQKSPVKPPRLMLQSVGLSFADPSTGERCSFVLPPDPAFDHLLQQLRLL